MFVVESEPTLKLNKELFRTVRYAVRNSNKFPNSELRRLCLAESNRINEELHFMFKPLAVS